MKYKKWSLEEKLDILSSSEALGIVETCGKHTDLSGLRQSWPYADLTRRIQN